MIHSQPPTTQPPSPLTQALAAAKRERRNLMAEREAREIQIDSAGERGQLAGSTLAAADSLDVQIAEADARITTLRRQLADAIGTNPLDLAAERTHAADARRANAAARSRARRAPVSGLAG